MRKSQSYPICFLLIIIALLAGKPVIAQLSAGTDDTISAGVAVRLSAVYGEYATPVLITDDGVEGPFPIGFNFSFFGKQYNQFWIGANGWISFTANTNAAGTRGAFLIPSADPKNPRTVIMGPFQDMNPEGSDFIFYQTTGDSLSRKLVVMWCQTPMFSEFCSDSLVTFQIILHEGTNQIENMIMHKPSCPDWMNNLATIGVQNETGFIGYAAPGRNATSWSATHEAWRFIPVTVDSFQIVPVAYHLEPIVPQDKIRYSWYQGPEFISNDPAIVVTPNETSVYTVTATICQGDQFTDTINVFVIPFIPNAFTPNDDGLNDIFKMTGIPRENVTQFSLHIYDRWGRMLFSTTDIDSGWNGTCNGEICPAGVYAWIITYDENKLKVTNKGTIMLLR